MHFNAPERHLCLVSFSLEIEDNFCLVIEFQIEDKDSK